MPREYIDDADDLRLADYRDLTDTALRRVKEPQEGLYIAESVQVIQRALGAGHTPRSVLTQRRWLAQVEEMLGEGDTPVFVVADEVAEQVTGYAVHRGALASMRRPEMPSVSALLDDALTAPRDPGRRTGRARIAILDGLADHTNVGACFRSAAAMGIDAVLVTPQCADPLYRRSVRVSMGTVFQVPWTRIDEWPDGTAELARAGFVTAGMTLAEGAITLDDLVAEDHPRLALVFGNEGTGLSPLTQERLDRRVTIPMMGGVDSLNVAASSAVAFYATR